MGNCDKTSLARRRKYKIINCCCCCFCFIYYYYYYYWFPFFSRCFVLAIVYFVKQCDTAKERLEKISGPCYGTIWHWSLWRAKTLNVCAFAHTEQGFLLVAGRCGVDILTYHKDIMIRMCDRPIWAFRICQKKNFQYDAYLIYVLFSFSFVCMFLFVLFICFHCDHSPDGVFT